MSSRLIAAAACAALSTVLSLSSLSPAHAHVVLDKREAAAGSYFKAVFRVGHGCEGSPTTAVAVTLPISILSAKPQPKPGWTITIETVKLAQPQAGPHGKTVTERITRITWSGGPLPDAYFDEFALQMKLPDKAPGGLLVFPVLQTCEKGSRDWSETASAGDAHAHHHLKSPAPTLRLTAKP